MSEKQSQSQLEQIETLVQQLDRTADEETRDSAMELIQLVMELHRTGLERLLAVLTQQIAPNEDTLLRLVADETVSGLLLLHGLHPVDLSTRVNQALEKVRPYLKSHGGNVELTGIDDGIVSLRLQGSCHGCPSSAVTLKLAIEEAIYEFAPDIVRLNVEGVVQPHPANFIPVEALGFASSGEPAASPGSGWEEVAGLENLSEGETDARDLGDRSVLFLRSSGGLYAYENGCSRCGKALEAGKLTGSVFSCPDCGAQFDIIRAGRCLDVPTLHLEPLPLLVADGRTRIAMTVSP